MQLSPEDQARLKRVARLADATEYDGERQKSTMVCMNILREKGGMSLLQLVELAISGQPQRQQYPPGTGSRAWAPGTEPSVEDVFDTLFGRYSGGRSHRQQADDWFGREQSRARREQEENARKYREQEEAKKRYQEANRFFKHSRDELQAVMSYFFGVYNYNSQRAPHNEGMIKYILAHSYVPGVSPLQHGITHRVAIRATEATFIQDMGKKEGFDLYLSERQFKWLCEIYQKVRELVYMQNIRVDDKFLRENDILYKAFIKRGVPYL